MSDKQGLLDEHDLESFRQSGVYEIFPLLRKGILHRTSPKSYWGIKDSGFIIPNHGQFPYTYPQSKVYYAHSKGYVCLFDFESVSEEECIFIHHTWGGFFSEKMYYRKYRNQTTNVFKLPFSLQGFSAL